MEQANKRKDVFPILFALVVLFAFEVLHVFWQSGAKVIIYAISGKILWETLLPNLLLFVLFFLVMLWLIQFVQGKSIQMSKSEVIINLLILLLVEIVLDFLRIFAEKVFNGSYMLLHDTFTFISAVATLIVVEKRFLYRENIEKSIIIPIAITAAILIISILCDCSAMKSVSFEYLKHPTYEEKLKQIEENSEFRFWIRNALLDWIIFSLYFIRLSAISAVRNERIPRVKEIGVFSLRFLIVVTAVFVLVTGKNVIFPQGSITKTTISQGPGECSKSGFFVNDKCYTVKRFINGEETEVFHGGKIEIWQRNKRIISSRYDGKFNDALATGRNVYNDEWFEKTINGREMHIIANRFVLWDGNWESRFVDLTDEKQMLYDPDLICLCEKVLSDGYLEFFDFVCEYMLENDKTFIEPYINRYTNGEFNGQEIEMNEHLNFDYISSVASKLK